MKKRSPISLGLYPWIADTVFQLATNSNPAVTVQFREEILAEKINADPYGDGWIVRIQPSESIDESALMTPDTYQELLDQEDA